MRLDVRRVHAVTAGKRVRVARIGMRREVEESREELTYIRLTAMEKESAHVTSSL